MFVFLSSNKLAEVFMQEKNCKVLQTSAPTQVPHQKDLQNDLQKPPLTIPTLKTVPD